MDAPPTASGSAAEQCAAQVGKRLCVSATAALYLYPAVVEAYRRYQLTAFSGAPDRDSLMVTVLLEAGRTGRNLGRVDLHELWLQTAPAASRGESVPGPRGVPRPPATSTVVRPGQER